MDTEFEKWCDQWQDALNKDTFPKVSPEEYSSIETHLGPESKKSKRAANEFDGQYWDDIHRLSTLYGNDHQVLSEHLKNVLQSEEVSVDMDSFVKEKGMTPNPNTTSSVGMDQDLTNPISTGATYSVSNLQDLESLKIKLHDLLVKLNSSEVQGQSGSAKLESQIQSLQKQIDELSDSLGRTGLPGSMGDQH